MAQPFRAGLPDEGCRIYEGEDAARKLATFGLRFEHFEAAKLRGLDGANRALPVHARTHGGYLLWSETVGELRTQLLALNSGWKIGQTAGYETAYKPDLGMAIAVVAGDTSTGERAFHHPKTARRRGPVTAKRVSRNAMVQRPFDLPGMEDKPEDDELCETWFLLMNSRRGVLYSELSLPLLLGNDGRVSRWSDRILLPELKLQGAEVNPIDDHGDDDDAPRIHVGRK